MPIPTAAEHDALMFGLRAIQTALNELTPAISAVESYPAGSEAHAVLRGLASAALEIKTALEVETANTPEFRRRVETMRLQQRADRLGAAIAHSESLAARARGANKMRHEEDAARLRPEWQAVLADLSALRGS